MERLSSAVQSAVMSVAMGPREKVAPAILADPSIPDSMVVGTTLPSASGHRLRESTPGCTPGSVTAGQQVLQIALVVACYCSAKALPISW
jgi:hypothetical protein